MKKLLLSALALVALVACNNDEVVRHETESFITFGDSFVENKTRAAVDPSTTTATIDAFDVWGLMNTSNGLVFNQERVTRGTEGWSYENTQYWTPEDNYYFHAISPVDDANIVVTTENMLNTYGLGNIAFTNVDGTTDLLYASKHVETTDEYPYYNQNVTLQFMHLLSKIKFTFKNGFTNNNASLAITNIKIIDAPALGNIDVNGEAGRPGYVWNITQNDYVELAFGNVNGGDPIACGASDESAFERLTIPADDTRSYTIEFDLELFYGEESGMTSHKEIKLDGQKFEIGKNYNLVAEITPANFVDEGLNSIEFDVVVEDWEYGGEVDVFEDEETVEPVALAAPVVAAEVDGNVVTLTWEAIENAYNYSVTVGAGVPVFVEDPTYVFTGEYETEYTFSVVALPDDETLYTVSEAGTATVTTEAEPVVGPTYTTVAEFLAAAEDESATAPMYTLKGTITAVANTSYGNFDLTDDTGTVLIYGLMSPDGATNKYWAASGAKIGDDIVVKTVRTSFNGTAQGKNAWFVELVSPGTRAFYTVDPEAVDFASAGGEQDIEVFAYNTSAAVTATSDNAAFAVNVNGYVVTVTAAANELEEQVTGNITIQVGDLEPTVVKATLAAKPASGVVEGGSDDFHTISATNTSYVSGKTTAGWNYKNCAIFKGGTSDASPAFKMIGDAANRALCMNGKTSAVGSITSPTLTTGCGTLKFNYGLPFSDTKIKFRVDIIQDGAVVKTFTIENSSAAKYTLYSHEEVINVAGEFQIVFTNLSPSNSTSNKDRTAIWDVEWTGFN